MVFVWVGCPSGGWSRIVGSGCGANRQVFSHALGIFATDDTAMLALLSSSSHYWWAKTRGSSMKTDLRYTPSDVFETFPLPRLTEELRAAAPPRRPSSN